MAALQNKNHYTRSGNTPNEEKFLQIVKDNLKNLLKYDGNPLEIDLHIQSYNDPTFYLGHDQNGFKSLIARSRTASLIIWKFVYDPTVGNGAGVLYTHSNGHYWHFNNISNPNVSLEIQQLDDPMSFGSDPSDLFIITVGGNNQKFIHPYYHQNMYVQYDATIPTPTTLDVKPSIQPHGAFIITEVLNQTTNYTLSSVLKLQYTKATLAVFGAIIATIFITYLLN